jgi:hypothetical protein
MTKNRDANCSREKIAKRMTVRYASKKFNVFFSLQKRTNRQNADYTSFQKLKIFR